MTQALNEFFLSEDIANFATKNDESPVGTKPLWVSLERHGNLYLALALGIGQTVIGPLMQFDRDTPMSCEFASTIAEKNAGGFSVQVFFQPENKAYFHNYDLKSEEDRYFVLSLVAAEYNLWKRGRRAAESHSVYRRR